MSELPHQMYSTWLHSFEEDDGDIEVYRPDGYDFPPARRPRAGVEFGPGGLFADLTPGPDDRPERRAGRWDCNDMASEIYVTREFDMAPTETLEIVEASDRILRIRRGGAPGMW